MAKAPSLGQVKTRLCPPLTHPVAAQLNKCFLRDLGRSISITSLNHHSCGIAVYTPVGAEKSFEGIFDKEFFFLPQRGDSLEERVTFAAQDLFQAGFGSVCLINSDSPTVPSTVFAGGADLLLRGGSDIVLGPAHDGGYYLIGFNKLHARLFEQISWSTNLVLRQTLERAEDLKLVVHMLPAFGDVDDRVALKKLCDELFALDDKQETPAVETRKFLIQMVEQGGHAKLFGPE